VLQRHLSLTPADKTITGRLVDQAGQGIAGVELYGLGRSAIVTSTATNEVGYILFGNTDSQGNFSLPVRSGAWSLSSLPGVLARLGFLLPSDIPSIEVVTSNVILPELRLPKFTALIYGAVKTAEGKPLAGVVLSASGPNHQTTATSDASGNYSLGVIEGDWTLGVRAAGFEEQTVEVKTANDQSVLHNFVLKPVTVSPGDFLRPILQIALTGNTTVLTWPTNAADFFLETTTSLSPPFNWTPVSARPATRGNESVVVEAVTPGSRFYRLRRAQ